MPTKDTILHHILLRRIEEENIKEKFKTKHYSCVDAKHFDVIIDAMNEVVNNGTGRNAQIDSIEVCGKTGTVENKNFNDHSVFISFCSNESTKNSHSGLC